MKLIVKSLMIVLISTLTLGLTGCWESDTENAVEDMGEKVEQTTEDMGDKAEEAGEQVQDAAEEAQPE